MIAKCSSILHADTFFSFTKCLENESCMVRLRVEILHSFADCVKAKMGL